MIQPCAISALSVPRPEKSIDGWNDIEEWPRERDRKFKRKWQKMIIIVDNCPAHPEIKGLKSIDLHFFPHPVLNT